jgi:hypothetical protein
MIIAHNSLDFMSGAKAMHMKWQRRLITRMHQPDIDGEM